MSALTPISGHTRVFGIVADPVGHVQTPQRLNTMMAAQGIDSVTVPLHVSAPDLPVLVAGLRT